MSYADLGKKAKILINYSTIKGHDPQYTAKAIDLLGLSMYFPLPRNKKEVHGIMAEAQLMAIDPENFLKYSKSDEKIMEKYIDVL